MMESKTTNLEMHGLQNDNTPHSVRPLPKEPGTSLKEVSDDEWAVYLSSGRHSTPEQWENMAEAFRDAGFSATAHNKGLTVW